MGAYRDALDALAPWDAIPYFQTPVQTLLSFNAGGTKTLVTGDPMRVALVVSNNGNTTVYMRLIGTTSGTFGYALPTAAPTIKLLFSELGPLVQQGWEILAQGTGNVTAYTVSLAKWPALGVPKRSGRNGNAS